MFLYSEKYKRHRNYNLFESLQNAYLNSKNTQRKVKLSPPNVIVNSKNTGTFFFAPLKASLTVEAAIVLPLFLFVMICVLQYAAVMGTAAKIGTGLADTGKSIAAAAYVTRYGGDAGVVPEIAASALSAAYAQGKVMSKAGNPSSVKSVNMVLSSFLAAEEAIDLVMTYQIRSPLSIIHLPGNFFIQRARVRAWTGRVPPGSGDGEDDSSDQKGFVYVTETGSVYHDDPDCTHLKLSIQIADTHLLGSMRNNNGGKYHACEKCGVSNPQGFVYITKEGDRYHSSLSCSGLKRTVRQVSREELGNMRACSKCGKKNILDYLADNQK